MKKVFFALFSFFVFLSSAIAVEERKEEPAAVHRCRLLVSPVNPQRGVDWTSELLVVIDEEKLVTMATGNGGRDTCLLGRGIAVVVDRDTRVAKWILVCGNDVLFPVDWRPGGRVIAHEDRLTSILEEQIKLLQEVEARLGVVEQKLDDLMTVARPATVLDIEGAVRRAMAEQKPSPIPPAPPKRSWWSSHWWVIPVAIIVISITVFGGGGNKKSPERGGPTIP